MADFPSEGGPLLPPPPSSPPDALRERRDAAASLPNKASSPGASPPPPPPPAPARPGGTGTLREGAFAATPPRPPSPPAFSDRAQPQQPRQRRRRDEKNSARWKPMRPGAEEAAIARPQHPQLVPSYAGEATAVAVLATPEQVGLPPPTTLVTPPPAAPPATGGLGIHQLQTPPGAAGDIVVLHQHHLNHNPGHAAAATDQPSQHQPLPVFYHGTPQGHHQHHQQHQHHVQLLPQTQPQPQPELFVGHYQQQPRHGPSFLAPPPEHHQHQPQHYQHQQLAAPAPHYHQYHHVGPASNAPAVVQYPPPPLAAMTPLIPTSHGSPHHQHPHQFLVAHRHHVVGHPAPSVPMSAPAADGRNRPPRAERLAAALASMPPPAPGDTEPGARQLIVNYIAAQVDEAALRSVFGAVGPVERIHIERHAPSGGSGGGGSSRQQQPSRSRQFAFVYYARHQDALNAIVDVSGTVMNGRAIKVDWSTQRGPARPGTTGYRPPAVPGGYSGPSATSAGPMPPPGLW